MVHDCIVVGSGPAGSTAARALARAGARVLILEKESLPRYKVCGGAVSGLAARWLDVPWREVSERRLKRVEVRFRFGPPLLCTTAEPYADFVMRDRFDYLLATEAVRAGAQLIDGCPARAVRVQDDRVLVETDRGPFFGRAVIGADGASSVVARAAGFGRPRLGAALEAEVEVAPHLLEEWADRTLVSYGDPDWGYGWVFPKARHLSIGVGTLRPGRSRLPHRLQALLDRLGLTAPPQRVTGHPIPLPRGRVPLASQRLLLAGDAAGLADPLSGEGIAHAVRSGQLAAEAVAGALETGDFNFPDYSARIWTYIGESLHVAHRIAQSFYLMPGLFFTLFQRSPGTLSFYFDVVRGKATYRDMMARLWRDLSATGLKNAAVGSLKQ